MNRFFTIIFIFLFTFAPAGAFEIQRTTLEGIIVSEVTASVKKQLSEYKPDSIEVKIVNLPAENVVVASEKMPKIEVISNSDKFMQYDIKRVVISENGKTLRVIPTSVKISVYKDVLVAKDYISQFGVINNLNTYKKRMEVGATIKETLSSISEPIVATRNVSKDGLILNCYTKSRPDVVRNSLVKIIFTKGDEFNIEADGVALREGRVGDMIVVKNEQYKKMYSATVIDTNKVEVKL